MLKRFVLVVLLVCAAVYGYANAILIPMDESQKNHLKAYGIAYFILGQRLDLDWLLNYRGGSFLVSFSASVETECKVRGVSYEVLSEQHKHSILREIADPEVNMNVIRLEKAPAIAVYSPKNEFILDETDAVILVLDYAEIPYDILYDEEVIHDSLLRYDWLHLHHEDFTGQRSRSSWRESSKIEFEMQEITARKLGYATVPQMKLAVALRIKDYCAAGGFLFAMCSGAETFDIALAAGGITLDDGIFDTGDPEDELLDFTKTLAFENFTLDHSNSRRFSDINTGRPDFFDRSNGFFTIFDFSAKWDIVPTLLNQNHEHVIKEFSGLTTAFNKYVIKPTTLVLGENKAQKNVRYIYGELGRGHWTFYSGHDPEGSPGRGRKPTDLHQHPNSPGYRLILNNVLFPSAKKKKQKT